MHLETRYQGFEGSCVKVTEEIVMDNQTIAKIISAMSDVFDRTEMSDEEKKLCDMGIALIAMLSRD